MIKAKFFIENEKFYLKNSDKFAILQSNGKLEFNGEIYDMHSLAATLKKTKAKRLNGFEYWFVMRDERLVKISQIREEYRKNIKFCQ